MGGYNIYCNRCSVVGISSPLSAPETKAKIQPIGWSVPNILNKAAIRSIATKLQPPEFSGGFSLFEIQEFENAGWRGN